MPSAIKKRGYVSVTVPQLLAPGKAEAGGGLSLRAGTAEGS
ncbi:hypothetical protein ABT368_08245 [Streptomyces althioticus]